MMRNAVCGSIDCSLAERFTKVPSAVVPRAANDNTIAGHDPAQLRAALKHFAEHHLHAARDAHTRASMAKAGGNHAEFVFWADICGALDRRLAKSLAADEPASC